MQAHSFACTHTHIRTHRHLSNSLSPPLSHKHIHTCMHTHTHTHMHTHTRTHTRTCTGTLSHLLTHSLFFPQCVWNIFDRKLVKYFTRLFFFSFRQVKNSRRCVRQRWLKHRMVSLIYFTSVFCWYWNARPKQSMVPASPNFINHFLWEQYQRD